MEDCLVSDRREGAEVAPVGRGDGRKTRAYCWKTSMFNKVGGHVMYLREGVEIEETSDA